MRRYATGWACNLSDLLVRFPYEKYSTLSKLYSTKLEKVRLVKKVFLACLKLILLDIAENNVTFELPPVGYAKAEIHMESIRGEEFKKLYKAGKFRDVDFLESIFTGNRIAMFLKSKHHVAFFKKKVPIYVGNDIKNIITENTNNGKQYG